MTAPRSLELVRHERLVDGHASARGLGFALVLLFLVSAGAVTWWACSAAALSGRTIAGVLVLVFVVLPIGLRARVVYTRGRGGVRMGVGK